MFTKEVSSPSSGDVGILETWRQHEIVPDLAKEAGFNEVSKDQDVPLWHSNSPL